MGGRGLGSRLLAAGKVAMPSWRPASELEGGDEFAKSEREITLSLAAFFHSLEFTLYTIS